MAIVTIPTRVDDLNGKPGATFTTFAYDGTHYGIDLADENRDRLRGLLAEFIAKAQILGHYEALAEPQDALQPLDAENVEAPQEPEPAEAVPAPKRARRAKAKPRAQRREMRYGEDPTPAQLRAWAAAEGLNRVPQRGRLDGAVSVAYQACRRGDDSYLEKLRQDPKFKDPESPAPDTTTKRPTGSPAGTTRKSGKSDQIAEAG